MSEEENRSIQNFMTCDEHKMCMPQRIDMQAVSSVYMVSILRGPTHIQGYEENESDTCFRTWVSEELMKVSATRHLRLSRVRIMFMCGAV